MRRGLVPILALSVAFAAPAAASDHLMTVSELSVSEGGDQSKRFVELVDPADEPFPAASYGLALFTGAGLFEGSQPIPAAALQALDGGQPYLLASNNSSAAGIRDQQLTIPLFTTAGQVCFYRNSDPTVASNRINCLRYGTITGPVSAGATNQGPTPGTGQSLQVCGSTTVVAAPTPKAANRCTGAGGGGGPGGDAGGTTDDNRKPKATLGGRRTQDVDKLAVTVTLDEAGTVSATGTVRVPNSSKTYRFKRARKTASAGRRVTLRLKLSRKAKRAVKRSLRRGRKLRAKLVVTGTDGARNRTTKRKTVRLKN